MYTKDKNNRITLRLNDRQMEYVVNKSETFKISPSDFLRMIITQNMGMEVKRRENEQTYFNH